MSSLRLADRTKIRSAQRLRRWLNRSGLFARETQSRGIVVRALHKSGSMFLFKFFAQVAADADVKFYSANLPSSPETALSDDVEHSFCVCPLRTFKLNHMSHFPQINESPQIFHVRDPRDMIVSEYFSVGWTHPTENWTDDELAWREQVQQMSVDEYALHQPELSRNPLEKKMAPILEIDPQKGHILVKYETMVTRFDTWIRQVLEPFEFRCSGLLARLYTMEYRHEFRSTGERLAHKRRIVPGDYLEKLKPSTIRVLNQRYAPILDRLGYRA